MMKSIFDIKFGRVCRFILYMILQGIEHQECKRVSDEEDDKDEMSTMY